MGLAGRIVSQRDVLLPRRMVFWTFRQQRNASLRLMVPLVRGNGIRQQWRALFLEQYGPSTCDQWHPLIDECNVEYSWPILRLLIFIAVLTTTIACKTSSASNDEGNNLFLNGGERPP